MKVVIVTELQLPTVADAYEKLQEAVRDCAGASGMRSIHVITNENSVDEVMRVVSLHTHER